MRDMEKQKFEEEWKDAFKQAEVSPSENLWTNIELNLEKAETGKMKSRLLFYKLTAAASVLFAMAIAGAWTYYYNTRMNDLNSLLTINQPHSNTPENSKNNFSQDRNNESEKGVSQKENQHPYAKNRLTTDKQPRENNSAISEDDRIDASLKVLPGTIAERTSKENTNKTIPGVANDVLIKHDRRPAVSVNNSAGETNLSDGSKFIFQPGQKDQEEEPPVQLKLKERQLPKLVIATRIRIPWQEQVPDPVAVMMAQLEKRERELMGEDNKTKKAKENHAKTERLWTSVGFATGSFNSLNQNSSSVPSVNTFASNTNNITANQSKASGTTYSMGMNVGTKLSERWILQGGVNYLAQNSSYEANSVVGNSSNLDFQAASINSLSSKNAHLQSSKLVATVPYNVDNSLRFVSVPVQAGYMMVNHAVGVQINGGVSTDLFLQNKLSPQSSSLPTVTQNGGDDSPYRTVNFSGLLGTEISYRFSKHYRLALNPGVRYPLNSIYKSEVGVKANPLTFDVGMRFRYIFR